MKNILLTLSLILIAISEISLRIDTRISFIFYALILSIILFSLSRKEKEDDFDRLMIVLMILPVLRISELFINFNNFIDIIFSYYILFFLSAFFVIKFKMKIWQLKNIWFFPLVIIWSILIGLIGNTFIPNDKNILIVFLIPIIAFSEEIFFRGLLQNLIKSNYNNILAIVLPSLIYALFALSFGAEIAVFFLIVNLLIGILYFITKNIYLCIFMNMTINLLIFSLERIF